ncbi:dTDP-glucose 4 6-dehydratase [Prevotella sp. CAG:1124]|nr:dTDP-glucose 4 6-dehydratase [Prevotella sp. CAG:1124]
MTVAPKNLKTELYMKTYLVTGAAGFIGSNFVKYLLYRKYKDEDIKVIVLDALTYAGNYGTIKDDVDGKRCVFVHGDIRDRELADSLFADNDIDYVVNFAAESHVDRSIENPQLFLETNILGTQNLLDAARRAWVTGKDATGYPTWKEGKRFHQVSTDEVYGSLGADGYFTEETPLCPHSPYSASKTSADLIVKAYHDTYHMPVTITRCSNNYGPYHFPEKLIPLIINNILEGKPLPVYGKGDNVRDWLYVEDHCKAIDLVVREGRDGEVYNVGGHNEMKNIDIVKLTIKTIHDMMAEDKGLRKILKKQVIDANGDIDISWINNNLITFVTDRLGHDQRYAIDPTKIKNELGWLPETMFADGIVKTIRWNLEHQDWVNEVTSGEYTKYYEQMYGNR